MGIQNAIASSINSVVNQSNSIGMPSRVVQAIQNAATRTGVDFSYLLQKASQESGLDATARATTSSATGLFQFTNQTWLGMIKNNGAQYGLGSYAAQITTDSNGHMSVSDPAARQAILGLRSDPQISAEMAGELDKQNAAALQQNVGGKIGGTELYLAHFLGAAGASDFLSTLHDTPNATGASVLPEAAAANPSVFYNKSGQPRTLAQIYQHFALKFSGDNSGTTQLASAAAASPAATVSPSSSPAASTAMAYAVASSAPLPANLAKLFASSSPVSASGAATSSYAGFRSADGGTMVSSGSSTLFTAMVLGQMQKPGMDPYAALDLRGDKKKSADSALSAVA